MGDIKISIMTKDDLLTLKDCLASNFNEFWTFNVLEQEFYGENKIYITAKQDDKIVGFAGLLTIIDEANVMNIVVDKSHKRQGIGTLLLEELIRISKQKNMKSITLEVNENNIPAIKLYEKFNFEKAGIRKKYYNNTDSAILMTLYI